MYLSKFSLFRVFLRFKAIFKKQIKIAFLPIFFSMRKISHKSSHADKKKANVIIMCQIKTLHDWHLALFKIVWT